MRNAYLYRTVRVFIIGLGFLSLHGHVAQAYPARLALSQVDVYLPSIRIYVNLLDGAGNPIHPLSERNFTVMLDGQDIAITKLALFKDTDEGIAYTLLIDISKTMAGAPFTQSLQAAQGIIEHIGARDSIAIIAFGDDVSPISDFTNDKDALLAKLRAITPDHNNTHFYAAVNKAYELNKRQDQDLPRRRAILVISDGKDEGSGIILDDLLRQNDHLGIPIYSIGYSKIERRYLDHLKRLSELSGGRYLTTQDTQEFSQIYQEMFSDLQSHYVIYTECQTGTADGSTHQMIVIYHQEPYRIQTEKKVTFVYQEPTPTPAPTLVPTAAPESPPANVVEDSPKTLSAFLKQHIWLYGIPATGMLFLLLLALLVVNKRKKTAPQHVQLIEEEESGVLEKEQTGEEEAIAPPEKTSQKTLLSQKELERGLPVIKLIVLKGKLAGQEYALSVNAQGTTLGKEGADLIIDDKEVSNIHCSLAWIKNHLMLQDEGSAQGTFLNGIPITIRMELEDGDVIEIGQCRMRLKILSLPV